MDLQGAMAGKRCWDGRGRSMGEMCPWAQVGNPCHDWAQDSLRGREAIGGRWGVEARCGRHVPISSVY